MGGNPLNRDQKIAIGVGVCLGLVTVIGIVLPIVLPEVRTKFGLDRPPNVEQADKRQAVPKPVTPGAKTQAVPKPVTPAVKPKPRSDEILVEKVQAPSSPDDLSGVWSATYPGGPLKVSIRQIEKRVVATLLTGNGYVPAGEITFHGTYDSNPFHAQQVCAHQNFTSPFWVNVQIHVIDGDHMTEDLISANCSGFPVLWHRLRNSAAQ